MFHASMPLYFVSGRRFFCRSGIIRSSLQNCRVFNFDVNMAQGNFQYKRPMATDCLSFQINMYGSWGVIVKN